MNMLDSLSSTLARFIEEKSGEIVKRWAKKVASHASTGSFAKANLGVIERDAYEVLREFERWMSSQATRTDIGRWYAAQGQSFFKMGIPLCEVYRAHILLKNILQKFVEQETVQFDSAIQVSMLREFQQNVDFFFEQAFYYLIRGYAEAMNDRMMELWGLSDNDTVKVFFGRSFYGESKGSDF